MPLYEYECQSCGKRTEILQRLDEAPLAACPQCGGEVKKLLSPPAVQFKGSGWYVTDYAGKGSSKTESKDKEAKSGSSAKTETASSSSSTSGSSGSSGGSGSSD